ncbi:unnamed protein product [Caenorhabditis auriculariae]|uniref:Uncharacterized protein n=1 Tax=Caenorhabditis auriculariae TaxID=2777116 RepID=A0A8S1GZF8_9PELO|nr:unnamed protein product [Caenorhabditis auriculariae]
MWKRTLDASNSNVICSRKVVWGIVSPRRIFGHSAWRRQPNLVSFLKACASISLVGLCVHEEGAVWHSPITACDGLSQFSQGKGVWEEGEWERDQTPRAAAAAVAAAVSCFCRVTTLRGVYDATRTLTN